MSSHPAHLEPSELGTKEYWDKLYTTELRNHAADSSDIGTCWFDDSDAEARILRFLKSLTPDSFPAGDSDSDSDDEDEDEDEAEDGHRGEKKSKNRIDPPLSREGTSFLDLGCGNGALLFALRDAGWQGRMLGIDYSPQSISLARQIARSRGDTNEDSGTDTKTDADTNADANADADADTHSSSPIEFAEWDLLAGPMSVPGPQPWDVVLDKGTFDAISLSGPGAEGSDGAERARRPVESYRERMLALVRRGGLFVVTSCNWTEDELRAWFEGEAFAVVGGVDYPTFTFGGVKGQTITTLCFQRGR